MKKLFYAIPAILLLLASCREEPDYTDTPTGNFDLLWKTIDEHYCFFADKDVDWEKVRREYRPRISGSTDDNSLFNICAGMLDELRDGHVNLVSRFNTSFYRKWWSDYPQDFNLRTLEQYYLGFDYRVTSGISYKVMDGGVGYIYYPSFSATISEISLDYVLAWMSQCQSLIIDVRDNGGGNLSNIGILVSRFIDTTFRGAYIYHKDGPGHSDFSKPYPIDYKPAPSSRIKWSGKPVYILTNRSCYSATNAFVAVMKQLPEVTIVGARTGGGGGLPFTSELPNGWSVRFSACPVTDASHRQIENGVDPSDGCEVHCTDEELAAGTDAILDFALGLARNNITADK